jgi:hypothetical protein
VKNTGNGVINDLSFDIQIPGKHEVASAHAVSTSPRLVSSIRIDPSKNVAPSEDKAFEITLPYLNPDETFKITVFYDGPLTSCYVDARLPGVTIKTTTEEDVQRRSLAIEDVSISLGKASGNVGVLLGAIFAYWLWNWLLR